MEVAFQSISAGILSSCYGSWSSWCSSMCSLKLLQLKLIKQDNGIANLQMSSILYLCFVSVCETTCQATAGGFKTCLFHLICNMRAIIWDKIIPSSLCMSVQEPCRTCKCICSLGVTIICETCHRFRFQIAFVKHTPGPLWFRFDVGMVLFIPRAFGWKQVWPTHSYASMCVILL